MQNGSTRIYTFCFPGVIHEKEAGERAPQWRKKSNRNMSVDVTVAFIRKT
jgi:hypothetical protein